MGVSKGGDQSARAVSKRTGENSLPNNGKSVDAALRRGPGRYKVDGVEGLYLKVGARGAAWHLRYTLGGRREFPKLGTYPAMTLAEAVRQAEKGLSRVRAHGCTLREPARTKATFGSVMDDYLRAKRGTFAIRTWETKKWVFTELLKPLRSKRVVDVSTDDIRRLANSLDRKMGSNAWRVVKESRALLEWAKVTGEYGLRDNVAAHTGRKDPTNKRDRYLSADEIVTLWRETVMPTRGGIALRLLLLTGQRTKELRLARWADIDTQGRIWTVRNRKGSEKPLQTPLSELALSELERLRGWHPTWVIPGRDRTEAVKDGVFRQEATRIATRAGMENWCPHDLRRTLKTHLSELGVDAVVSEKILGHSLPKLLQVYDRGEQIEQKREALEKFGDFVEALTRRSALQIA